MAVFIGTFGVMFLGALGFKKYQAQWHQRFLQTLENHTSNLNFSP